MDDNGVSRREFLTGAAALLLSRGSWAQAHGDLGLYWRLDDEGDDAREAVSGAKDRIASRTGHARWVGNGHQRALRLDGYSVWIDHAPGLPLKPPVSISAWLALEAYPVNEAALLEAGDARTGVSLSIDPWGYLRLHSYDLRGNRDCVSSEPMRRGRWTHVSGAISEQGELSVYCDGMSCRGPATEAATRKATPDGSIVIGKSSESPKIGGLFATGVLNGLIKDVRVYPTCLAAPALLRMMNEGKPEHEPDLQINGDWCGSDKQRPRYHAMPPRAWTNEPHGFIHFKNEYHLFYQKNANGPYWGRINWGHMTSPDMRQWTEMPVALSPAHGNDAEGCWSGSVIERQDQLCILYTAGDGHRASICLAASSDGVHFIRHSANPVIPAPPASGGYPEFRDPFVWREGDRYYAIIGSAVRGVGGTALLYRSNDLVHWEFRRPLLVGDRESSGVFWEMPIFVAIGDYHVLIVCEVPGRASYWVGTWKDEVFTPLSAEPQRLELFNHLLSPTPHSTPGGEVIVMGIIPDQRSPKECWSAGWAHLYSLPRTLSLDAHGRLEQRPWKGLEQWESEAHSFSNLKLQDRVLNTLQGVGGRCLHLRAVLKQETSRAVEVILRRSPDDRERTVLRYEWEIGRLVLDRTRSSLDPEAKRDVQEATYFPLQDGALGLEIYLDVSVVEVFLDQRSAFATRIYPSLEESRGMAVHCFGGDASIASMTIATVKGSAPEGQPETSL